MSSGLYYLVYVQIKNDSSYVSDILSGSTSENQRLMKIQNHIPRQSTQTKLYSSACITTTTRTAATCCSLMSPEHTDDDVHTASARSIRDDDAIARVNFTTHTDTTQ